LRAFCGVSDHEPDPALRDDPFDADGADIIITADPSGKTWTALVGDASGNVCIAAIGPNWRSIIADVSFDQEG
jgi:hypothetical protein